MTNKELKKLMQLANDDLYTRCGWHRNVLDYLRLERGLVFKTKEETIECSEKMLECVK